MYYLMDDPWLLKNKSKSEKSSYRKSGSGGSKIEKDIRWTMKAQVESESNRWRWSISSPWQISGATSGHKGW